MKKFPVRKRYIVAAVIILVLAVLIHFRAPIADMILDHFGREEEIILDIMITEYYIVPDCFSSPTVHLAEVII